MTAARKRRSHGKSEDAIIASSAFGEVVLSATRSMFGIGSRQTMEAR